MLASASQSASLWSNQSFRSLSLLSQNLFQLLLTGPFRIALPGILHVMGGTSTLAGVMSQPEVDVRDAMAQIGTVGLAEWDPDHHVLLLADAHLFQENHCSSPNHLKNWWTLWQRIPACELRTAHLVTVRRCFPGLERMPNAWELWGNTFAPPLAESLELAGVAPERIRAFVGPTTAPRSKTDSRPPNGLPSRSSQAPASRAFTTGNEGQVVLASESLRELVAGDGRSARSVAGNGGQFGPGGRRRGTTSEVFVQSPERKRESSLSLSLSGSQTRARVEHLLAKKINDFHGSDRSDPCFSKNINDVHGSEELPKSFRRASEELQKGSRRASCWWERNIETNEFF